MLLTFGSTLGRLQIDNAGVCLLKVTGPVTPETLTALRRDAVNEATAALSRAMVARYDTACIAVSSEAFAGPVHGVSPGGWALPVALVVRPQDVPMFQEHAAKLALRGVIRGVFIDAEAAGLWAQRMARVGLTPRP